jgi:hypothetical protein
MSAEARARGPAATGGFQRSKQRAMGTGTSSAAAPAQCGNSSGRTPKAFPFHHSPGTLVDAPSPDC